MVAPWCLRAVRFSVRDAGGNALYAIQGPLCVRSQHRHQHQHQHQAQRQEPAPRRVLIPVFIHIAEAWPIGCARAAVSATRRAATSSLRSRT